MSLLFERKRGRRRKYNLHVLSMIDWILRFIVHFALSHIFSPLYLVYSVISLVVTFFLSSSFFSLYIHRSMFFSLLLSNSSFYPCVFTYALSFSSFPLHSFFLSSFRAINCSLHVNVHPSILSLLFRFLSILSHLHHTHSHTHKERFIRKRSTGLEMLFKWQKKKKLNRSNRAIMWDAS